MDELNNSEIKKLYDCDYRLKGEYNLEFPLEKFIFELPRYTLEFFLTKLLANFQPIPRAFEMKTSLSLVTSKR